MTHYSPQSTLSEARARYFEVNGFEGGGYEETFVKMKAGPIPIWFPNTAARVRAVKYHDLHHVLTEYETTWRGEAEIGAWEVATGCARHYPAWVLNLQAFAIGLFITPAGVYRAFIRGRRSANLYARDFDERLLAQRVGDVRRELRLDRPARPATRADRAAFAVWASIALLTLGGTALLTLAPPALLALAVLWWRGVV